MFFQQFCGILFMHCAICGLSCRQAVALFQYLAMFVYFVGWYEFWHRIMQTRQLWRQEYKGYNTWQFITEFMNKGWTKNSINRLLVKFRTADRRLGSCRRSAHTDENVDSWFAVAESGRQTPEPTNSQRNFTWGRGSIDQFHRLFTKTCVLSATIKGALIIWLKRTACTRYFRYAV